MKTSKLIHFSNQFYKFLLLAYPAEFRQEYGQQMRQVFQDCCREAQREGIWGLTRLWLLTLSDLIVTLLKERLAVMRKKNSWKNLLFYCLAGLVGLVIGYMDTRSDEVQGSVLLLLVFTFIFGVTQPKNSWRWALLIGLGIPATYLIAFIINYKLPYKVYWITTFIALIPAFIGAYSGMLVRWMIRQGES
jgi:hypothetical protein